MIVVDVETSGVDPHKNSLLSIGAVDFSKPEQEFYGECHIWEGAHIEDEALEVNGFTRVEAIDEKKKSDKELLLDFLKWTEACEEKTLVRHNTSFDRDFLRVTAERYHINWIFAQRTLDLHSIAYYHLVMQGIKIPSTHGHSALNLAAVLRHVGLPEEVKPHNGLRGARLEAEAFSRLFYERGLLPAWKDYPIPWLKK